jgi:serine/threonine protein kinase
MAAHDSHADDEHSSQATPSRKRLSDSEDNTSKHLCLQPPPPANETLTFALHSGSVLRWYRRGPLIAEGRKGAGVYECSEIDPQERFVAWRAAKFVYRGRVGSQYDKCADTELAVGRLMAEKRHPNVSATLCDGEISFTTGRYRILINDPSACSLFDLFQFRVSGECRASYLRPSISAANQFYSPFHMMAQIVAGLAHLHRHGVLHNDIKASNVLVDANLTLKLCDYGLSRLFDSDSDRLPRLSFDGGPVGSKSPEALLCCTSIGRASDMYGLGCLMYRLYSLEHSHWMWSASNEDQLAQMAAHYGPLSQWHTERWAEGLSPRIFSQLCQKYVPTAQSCAVQALKDCCISDPAAKAAFHSLISLDPKLRPSCDQLLATVYSSTN